MKKSLLQFVVVSISFFLIYNLSSNYIEDFASLFNRIKVTAESPIDIIDYLEMIDEQDVFIISTSNRTGGISQKTIYVNSSVKKELENSYNLFEGEYHSVLGTSCKMLYKDYADMDVNCTSVIVCFLGNEGKYLVPSATGNITVEHYDAVNEISVKKVLRNIFVLAFVVVFVISSLDVELSRRRVAIEIVNGKLLPTILMKRMVKDAIIIIFSASFAIIFFKKAFLTSPFQNLFYVFVIMMIIAACVPNLMLLKLDFKKMINSRFDYIKTYLFCYILKVISIFLSIILISVLISTISQGVNQIKNRQLYNNFKTYSFISVLPKELSVGTSLFEGVDRMNSIQNDFFVKYYDLTKPAIQSIDNNSGELKVVIVNENSYKNIESHVNNFDSNKRGVSVFVKSENRNTIINSNYMRELKDELKTLEIDMNIYEYENRQIIPVLCSDPNSKETRVVNPSILYVNMDCLDWEKLIQENPKFLSGVFTSIAFDDLKLEESVFQNEYNLGLQEYMVTPISDYFYDQTENLKFILEVFFILSFLTFVFVINLSKIFFDYDLSVNGKNYSIQRVNGSSIFKIYSNRIKIDLITFVVTSIISVLFVNRVLILEKYDSSIVIAISIVFFITCLQMLFQLTFVRSKGLVKIIKSGY